MANWHVFSEDHEVPGQLIVDFEKAVGAEDMMPYFQKRGIDMKNIDPTAWYPMQMLLDVYNDMLESKEGTMFDFVSIGMRSASMAFVPPEFDTLPLGLILQGVGQVFTMNNRGTDPGSVTTEVVGDKRIKISMRTPSPDDLWYGVYHGFVQRFAKGTPFTVRYDDSVKRRDLGGDVTVLDISWQ